MVLVGKTRELTNHDKDDVVVCHVFFSLIATFENRVFSPVNLLSRVAIVCYILIKSHVHFKFTQWVFY